MIGTSPAFQRMRNAARLVAGTDVGVLLRGEPGSGRATRAREVHAQSPRRGGAFVPLHCAGAPDGALAAALGAASADIGPVAGAAWSGAGATLYLDEVGELPGPDQARLLRAIAAADHGCRAAVPRVIAASALAPTLQRGSKCRRSSVAWRYGPLSGQDCIPTRSVGKRRRRKAESCAPYSQVELGNK